MNWRWSCFCEFLEVLVAALLLIACSSSPALESAQMVTPLESAQIVPENRLPEGEKAALETFFARWGAYMAVVSIDAEDEEDVYNTLMDYTWTWKQAVTQTEDVQVLLYLPTTVGFLQVNAAEGTIQEASVSYDSQNADVRASLAFTVAGNALVYALSTDDDMSNAAAVYNTCMTRLNESGAEMEGTVNWENYAFSLTLHPSTHTMSFNAVENLAGKTDG